MEKCQKKIVFVTGTRADYGKIKALISEVEKSSSFVAYVYVSGMHLVKNLGSTYREVLKDGYSNVYVDFSQGNTGDMSYDLGSVICNFTNYVSHVDPDLIVVHGDRNDALAGAIVGALKNIRVAHIEGGELSGTIDESIRHAISKFAHIHLVSNEDAKMRLLQLGEEEDRIFIMGSPDIDVMLSKDLPSLNLVKIRYDIPFEDYGICMYHPVTTDHENLHWKIKNLVDALMESGKNYVVIYPNNDFGSELILNEYRRLEKNGHFKVYPSIRFEYFLTLLKNAEFMIGNSSAGVRETSVYGVPAIDLGSRQTNRYSLKDSNVQHCSEDREEILEAIEKIGDYKITRNDFGLGDSRGKFMEILRSDSIWKFDIQKHFIDRNIN
ncbi:UDP-N-acetylglucosamine 2-epimerase [Lachnospira pectinoschiza]|uniref:UDP-N-acetylglucosamine 2-epimerase (Hydrolysing) n=1 Tax=Lachnospira pectinoschiza TaxID=28052 RepID=A0A1G9XKE2_9FIRM|nr:UDP-N-acetylglucosamine 2-epimerase [Lachnospira pectinoschiza]SDM97244.1 UDP-N-acetylglucosamine 2-epimerase (hydrolysing) [Lachnospira pectinoschiza]